MKTSLATLRTLCPGIDEGLLQGHLRRLDEQYFQAFTPAEIAEHVEALSRLSANRPVETILKMTDAGRAECTVVAFDHPGEFSLITGVLTGMGFSIESGDVFTYRDEPAAAEAVARRSRQRDGRDAMAARRRIVDRFSGTVRTLLPGLDWQAELRRRLGETMGLLEQGTPEAAGRAKLMVNEWVAAGLSQLAEQSLPLLYPMSVEVRNRRPGRTTLSIRSQDTPAFLYALSSALALRGLSIEHVRIRTDEGRIHDELDVVDGQGRPIRDRAALSRLKLSVLLTKQFTYFLARAPDPYAALCRFEQMLDDVLRWPDRGEWLELISRPRALQDLARILGASDYIWEDLIRLQYESLRPILRPQVGGRRLASSPEELETRLQAALAGAADYQSRRRALNEFKDRELFLIDLDGILHAESDPRDLARPLTALAELMVRTAAETVYAELVRRHGVPRTVAGLEARYALFGLGKFGGAALGYASDIELLLVYSDSGRTDGQSPIENAEFFGALVRDTAHFISAKREGIFHVDLRLRPYGAAGPWACSLESFCRYYGPGGDAKAFERLALVRLRAVGGAAELGRQVERLRDEFVYETRTIRMDELRELRERQFAEKTRAGAPNAKFAPGGLVDLEYDVQLLQALHGKDHPSLRTPRIHEALAALSEAGILEPEESRRLLAAYAFLRRLINGLRMLRGSALDLFLPPRDSMEYAHLARRMGYERGPGLEPEERLHLDFETHTAAVRAFVERHFGRDYLPGVTDGNVADLLLSAQPSDELRDVVLRRAGFRDAPRAYVNLVSLMKAATPASFLPLAVLACDMVRDTPDPDMALNNWERLVRSLPDPAAHYEILLAQPRRFTILLGLLAGSQFLADTLIRDPDFFEWVTDPAQLGAPRDRVFLIQEFERFAGAAEGRSLWRRVLRRFRRREMVRIGARDLCLRAPIEEIMSDLSALAESLIQSALSRILREAFREDSTAREAEEGGLCVLALGKLGGGELNYSSDVDLVAICRDGAAGETIGGRTRLEWYEAVVERLGQDLSLRTEEGQAYRVDFRLRAYGRAGRLVQPFSALLRYYREEALLWEVQALLKMRPVAGDLELGRAFLEHVRDVFRVRREPWAIGRSIETMRRKALSGRSRTLGGGVDVKIGLGGLRDVEFLAQGLQLIHAPERPEVLSASTLDALTRLSGAGLLDSAEAATLREDYLFLRRVEHYLQILEDRQTHSLPDDEAALTALARRVWGSGRGDGAALLDAVQACQQRIRSVYARRLPGLSGGREG